MCFDLVIIKYYSCLYNIYKYKKTIKFKDEVGMAGSKRIQTRGQKVYKQDL